MRIWCGNIEVAEANALAAGSAASHLGMEITALGDDWIEGTLPVDARTWTNDGALHGGAAAVLAESLGSHAANFVLDRARQRAVGQQINATYLRRATSGPVTGRATPLQIQRETQVWTIEVRDAAHMLVSSWRLRMAVLDHR